MTLLSKDLQHAVEQMTVETCEKNARTWFPVALFVAEVQHTWHTATIVSK